MRIVYISGRTSPPGIGTVVASCSSSETCEIQYSVGDGWSNFVDIPWSDMRHTSRLNAG